MLTRPPSAGNSGAVTNQGNRTAELAGIALDTK